MKTIEAQNPDVVLIVGDFVDDDTTKEDMIRCCAALGEIKTTYGVYYVFGNHDKGYYSPEYRGYDGDDLIEELKKNKVHVMQDDVKLVDNRFYIIGRQDKSEDYAGGREIWIRTSFLSFWIISHRIMRHRQRRALIWCFPGIPTADSFFRL